ncbi:hypothetical protein BHM03_00032823 [Ensete ventricosum]|nr:hypothetical protein BHM03_00032823 [Ensete ventricosum]
MQRQEGVWIQGVNAMVLQRRVFRVCASKLASDESLGHQHMGAVYHQGRSQITSTNKSHGGDLIIQRYDQSGWRVGLLQCSYSLKGARQVRGQGQVVERGKEVIMTPVGLSYPKAQCRLERRWTRRSTTMPQRRIYRSRRKGCRCKATDSRAMGLTAPWYVEKFNGSGKVNHIANSMQGMQTLLVL